MDIAVLSDPSFLTPLEPEWHALWEDDPGATPFHSPEYARAWQIAFGQGRLLRAVEMRAAGVLAGLALLTIDPDGVLRFLGDAEITDYLGPIARPADRDAVAAALVRAIEEEPGWRVAELEGLAVQTGWPDAIARAAKAAGLEVADAHADVCPRVSTHGGFDAYLARLDGKLRHELRRKARKLERDAGPFTVRLTTRDRIDADLERFYEMHRSSTGPKGKFLHWGMEGMFKLMAREFEQRGWLRLAWLEVGGEPWAATFAFSARGVWSVYNSAYDHTKRELAPGMVLMGETIRIAAQEGCDTFDLLRGDEPYKYRFGATDVELRKLTLRRP